MDDCKAPSREPEHRFQDVNEQIVQHLFELSSGPRFSTVILSGPPRSGKSTILRQLYRRLTAAGIMAQTMCIDRVDQTCQVILRDGVDCIASLWPRSESIYSAYDFKNRYRNCVLYVVAMPHYEHLYGGVEHIALTTRR